MPPEIDNESASKNNLTVVLKNDLVIKCPVSGTPLPEVTWFKDNGLVASLSETNFTLSDGGRQLKIINSQVSDVGIYKCIGSNDAGNTTRHFGVDVHGNILLIHLSFAEPRTIFSNNVNLEQIFGILLKAFR